MPSPAEIEAAVEALYRNLKISTDQNGATVTGFQEAAKAMLEAAEAERMRIPLNDRSMAPHLRKMRADSLTAAVINRIGNFLEHEHFRDATRAIFTMFHDGGYDVVTDVDRQRAGLPPRGPYGLTDQELQILEHRRLEHMLNPAPPMMVSREEFAALERAQGKRDK
jgi:hypothetical protein